MQRSALHSPSLVNVTYISTIQTLRSNQRGSTVRGVGARVRSFGVRAERVGWWWWLGGRAVLLYKFSSQSQGVSCCDFAFDGWYFLRVGCVHLLQAARLALNI